MKLDDYFEAYDRIHDLAGGAPDWGTLRKKVRRSLARPALELTGQVVFLFACLALGIWGHRIGYLLALGPLCFIPQYVASLRPQIASIRDLSSEAELQQHLDKEAQRRMAGAVLGLVFYTGLALLFLGTAAVGSYETAFRCPVSSLSFRGRGLEGGSYETAFRCPVSSLSFRGRGLEGGCFRDRAARPEGRTTPPTDPDERN